ncbi:transmembrane protein, putative (macronuclear) [Tetrahymena thermophila SB210]|uniref:Transmembrane protein, putative n=1 Tax=Tetrahymena thermophila (strain SB210) TaxID=312017 RepID=W7WZ85_TETTS|nr:transmembrane protein, putative [Tetrahymena thermophila SB210]EWS72200.1 transmembrane protein, putative [Tetrahymena thermophila SB210]|eukprot:XP_012655243.1 transmembrane protein, putative [Tetrahymena thermophila SB210]
MLSYQFGVFASLYLQYSLVGYAINREKKKRNSKEIQLISRGITKIHLYHKIIILMVTTKAISLLCKININTESQNQNLCIKFVIFILFLYLLKNEARQAAKNYRFYHNQNNQFSQKIIYQHFIINIQNNQCYLI